jgi:FAD/FMN-containing dehydrogenase
LQDSLTLPAPPTGFRGAFRVDPLARAVYAEAAGIGRITPLAVAVPSDAEDVVTLVRWARATRTPLIPRGSGSSLAGGAIGHGVVVDVSELRAMGEVDAAERSVRVGPGALRGDVDRQARRKKLRFPVDPSSGEFCTIGGMVATNAAGAHTLRFGSMRRWVRALECVFDDGSRVEIRRGVPPPRGVPALERFLNDGRPLVVSGEEIARARHWGVRKDSSGYATADYAESYDLVDLLVGSEGTLAIFTGVELALSPVAGATSSVLGAFSDLEHATRAAVGARAAGAAACELLDRTFLDVARAAQNLRAWPVPADTEAVLLVETEGVDAASAISTARTIEALFLETGASVVHVALDEKSEAELWALRHAASPTLARLDPSLKSMQIIEDAAVPPARLGDYVRGVRESLDRNGFRGVIFGHAGDAHVHVNPLIDVRQPDWRERVMRLLEEVTALVASLGGTLTGEHGDGRLRTPLLDRVWDARARERFALVKQCFDPEGIFNPGVKVPVPHASPLEEIKYDPELPALPDPVRLALLEVENHRAYARSRLELLDRAERGALDG